MRSSKLPRLFSKVLLYFLMLGVLPILLITILFSIPHHLQFGQYRIFMGIFLILTTVSTLCLVGIATQLLKGPINQLLNAQQRIVDGDLSFRLDGGRTAETEKLFSGFNYMAKTFSLMQEKEKVFQEQQAVMKIASQVAHDIRSPLAALNAVTKNLPEVDEERRLLIRRAVQRIDDIANDLSSKKIESRGETMFSPSEKSFAQESQDLETHLLSSLVEPLISEKRLQHRSKLGIEIRSDLDEKSYGLFAKVNVKEFKRLLSNLINNAVEVLENSGQVIVSLRGIVGVNLSVRPDMVQIQVSDNGKGIPPEILSQLAQRGNTFGKEGGSGLGLYHARTTVENLGGEFKIESEMNHGTTVTILLPKEKEPSWFVSKIHLEEKMFLVIIDDDQSIHQIWKERLGQYIKDKKISITNFSNPEQLRDWYDLMKVGAYGLSAEASAKEDHSPLHILFLCDYEFLGSKETGLDVIEDLGLAKQTILVTSRYEEKDVRERCARLKIKLIPKPLAGFVPIHLY